MIKDTRLLVTVFLFICSLISLLSILFLNEKYIILQMAIFIILILSSSTIFIIYLDDNNTNKKKVRKTKK